MHILKTLLLNPILIARFYCGDALLLCGLHCATFTSLALIRIKTCTFFFLLVVYIFFQIDCQVIAPESEDYS